MTDYTIRPIGQVRSRLKEKHQAPHQGRPAGVEAELIIDAALLRGLEGIRAGEKLYVLCWLHMANRNTLRVHPRGNPAIPERGVFATRSQDRPNPIGLCLVDVLAIEGPVLKVRGLDAIDGTPVVDLKPYICSLDS